MHLLLALTLLSAPDPHLLPAELARARASVQQAAAPTSGSAEVGRLQSQLERLIESPGWPSAHWGVVVTSLENGETLYARSPEEPLTPASNMKLFTSAAALFYLGRDYRFTTYLLTDGPIEGDTLDGDVIIYGTGDPTLSDRFYPDEFTILEVFADSLEALGIKTVRGSVVGDASYWGGSETGVGWRETYMSAWYAAPTSALSYNENVVTLHIRPASEAGARPTIELSPGGEGIAIVNQATTIARGGTELEVERVAYDGPIVVHGEIARSQPGIWRRVPVADPPRYGAAVFQEILEARGIEVLGGIRSVERPADSRPGGQQVFAPAFEGGRPLQVLAVHRSPPLLEILNVVNRASHNMYAEQLLRAIGRSAAGEATVEAGSEAVKEFLQEEVGNNTVQMFDGSGLSARNRASAHDIVALLSYMDKSPMAADFLTSLPGAGERRLRRMVGTPAEQNLRAKTGTIEHVSALSGYVTAANGERLAFSIIGNDLPSTWRAKRVEDAIGARLGAFSRPRPATAKATVDSTGRPDVRTVIAPPAPASAPSATREYHEIQPGDTLEAIANRYGTSVEALLHANAGVDPRRLMPGRRLRLP